MSKRSWKNPAVPIGVGIFAVILGGILVLVFPSGESSVGVSGALGTPGWVLGGLSAIFGIILIVWGAVDLRKR